MPNDHRPCTGPGVVPLSGFVDAHVKCGVKDFEMEIRPMYGPEDFGGKP